MAARPLVLVRARNHNSWLRSRGTRTWSSHFSVVSLGRLLHIVTLDVFKLLLILPLILAFLFIFEWIQTARVVASSFIVVALCSRLPLGLVGIAILVSEVRGMTVGSHLVIISHVDLSVRDYSLLRFLHVLGVLRSHARQITLRVVHRAVLWLLPPGVSRLGGLRLHRPATRLLVLVYLGLILLHVLIVLLVLLYELLAPSLTPKIMFFRFLARRIVADVGVGGVLASVIEGVFRRFGLLLSERLLSLSVELVLLRKQCTRY